MQRLSLVLAVAIAGSSCKSTPSRSSVQENPVAAAADDHGAFGVDRAVIIGLPTEAGVIYHRVWFRPVMEAHPAPALAPPPEIAVEDIIAGNPAAFNQRTLRPRIYAFRLACGATPDDCRKLRSPTWIGAYNLEDGPQLTSHGALHLGLKMAFAARGPRAWKYIVDQAQSFEFWRTGSAFKTRATQSGGPVARAAAVQQVAVVAQMNWREQPYMGLEYLPADQLWAQVSGPLDPSPGDAEGLARWSDSVDRPGISVTERDLWLQLLKSARAALGNTEADALFDKLGSGSEGLVLNVAPLSLDADAAAALPRALSKLYSAFARNQDDLAGSVATNAELKAEFLSMQQAQVEARVAAAREALARQRDVAAALSEGLIKVRQTGAFAAVDLLIRVLSANHAGDGRTADGRQRLLLIEDPTDPVIAAVAKGLADRGWKVVYAATLAEFKAAVDEHRRRTDNDISLGILSHGAPGRFAVNSWHFGEGDTEQRFGAAIRGNLRDVTLFSCSVAGGVTTDAGHTMRKMATFFSSPQEPVPVRGFDQQVQVDLRTGRMSVTPWTNYIEVVPQS